VISFPCINDQHDLLRNYSEKILKIFKKEGGKEKKGRRGRREGGKEGREGGKGKEGRRTYHHLHGEQVRSQIIFQIKYICGRIIFRTQRQAQNGHGLVFFEIRVGMELRGTFFA
jgi:hypothetical protein